MGDAQPGGEQGEGEEVEGEVEVEEEEEEKQEEEEAIEREEGGVEVNFPATCQNKCLYFHCSKVTTRENTLKAEKTVLGCGVWSLLAFPDMKSSSFVLCIMTK